MRVPGVSFSVIVYMLLLVLSGCASLPTPKIKEPAGALFDELLTSPIPRIEAGAHTAPIFSIDADATGRVLVTGSRDETVRVWSVPERQLLSTLRLPVGVGYRAYAVAISPDGTTVAVGGRTSYEMVGFGLSDFSIYILDRVNSRLDRRLTGLPIIEDLAFSRDGRYLAASREGKNGIGVYRTDKWLLVAEDREYGDGSFSVDFASDGRLVSTSADGFIRLYSSDFRLLVKQKAPGGKRPFAARFSPDGARIAVGFGDTFAVNVLDARDLHLLYAPHIGTFYSSPVSVAWSKDGRFLYAGGYPAYGLLGAFALLPRLILKGELKLEWTIHRWRDGGRGSLDRLRVPSANGAVTDLHALADGRVAYATAFDTAFGMFDAAGHGLPHRSRPIADFSGNPKGLLLSHDGHTVQFSFESGGGRPARFSIDERKLTLLSADSSQAGATDLKAPRTKALLFFNTINLGVAAGVACVAMAADDRHYLYGGGDWVGYFDPEGNELWRSTIPGAIWCHGANIAGNGELAVAAFGDGTLRWFRLRDGKELLALFPHSDGKRWVLWNPEGFFDASPGSETLIGYHVNRGADEAPEFVKAKQLYDLFYGAHLVAKSLTDEGERVIKAELERIGGDVRKVLTSGLPPELELLSPKAITQTDPDVTLQFKVKDQGGGIGKIVSRVNGVILEGRPVGVSRPGYNPVSRRFILSPGENTIEFTAYSTKGVESRAIRATAHIEQPQEQPSLYVLALGITDYRDHNLQLKHAAADAKAMGQELGQRGQGLFQLVEVTSLFDDEATLANISKAFDTLAAQVSAQDVFVLYLAGHGTARNGRYHFVPWETIYENDAALRTHSLDEGKLQSLLAKIPAQKSLMLLDTCDSGAYALAALDQETAINRLIHATGRAVLAATSDKDMALEGHEGHGVFTYALLHGLRGGADSDANREIDIDELGVFVRKQVSAITKKRWGYEQLPMLVLSGQIFPIGLTP